MERKYALSNTDFKLMKQIMGSTEAHLLYSLPIVLKHYYGKEKIISTKDYVYVLGDIPVALIAHLDTVHRCPPTEFFHDKSKQTIWSPQGLGADDRAGVFSILKIIEAGYRPSIILTTKEESGGIGASKFISDFYEPKVATNFLIELDRCGTNDAVYYDLNVPEFENYITNFGFQTEWGTFSDISIIAPAWRRPAVNLSIGYNCEHSLGEHLNYQVTYQTIEKVKKILDDEITEAHIFPFGINNYSYWDVFDLHTQKNNNIDICNGCGEIFEKEQLITVEEDGYIYCFCPECYAYFVDYCDNCGNPYIKNMESSTEKLCEKCELEKIRSV